MLCDLRTASGASLPGGPFWAYNLMADSGPAGAAVLVMPNPGYLLWAWEGISPYGPPYMIIRVKPSAMIVTTGAAYDTSTGAFTRTTATIAAAARSDAIADNGQVTGLHETTTSYVSLAPTSNDLQRDDTTTTITGVSPAFDRLAAAVHRQLPGGPHGRRSQSPVAGHVVDQPGHQYQALRPCAGHHRLDAGPDGFMHRAGRFGKR